MQVKIHWPMRKLRVTFFTKSLSANGKHVVVIGGAIPAATA